MRLIYPNSSFWDGKKVLITGHTGFKGAWMAFWLHRLGAKVVGFALEPASKPNLYSLLNLQNKIQSYIGDIRDSQSVLEIIVEHQPEIVFNLAAQSLVLNSYRDPLITFQTNLMGTVNLLDAIRLNNSARIVVMVTTDKVYQNNEWVWPYRENDPLGGYDPYSASKAASEIVIDSWRRSFFLDMSIALASVRAGNVIGGGDWSHERLIPDALRSWQAGLTLKIRRPQSIRPWQHVVEPLAAYLHLAETLWQQPSVAGAFNFGPQSHESLSVYDVVEIARNHFPNSNVDYMTNSSAHHEAGMLTLETSKAKQLLGVCPRFSTKDCIDRTMNWYIELSRGKSAESLCNYDIDCWEQLI